MEDTGHSLTVPPPPGRRVPRRNNKTWEGGWAPWMSEEDMDKGKASMADPEGHGGSGASGGHGGSGASGGHGGSGASGGHGGSGASGGHGGSGGLGDHGLFPLCGHGGS